MRTLVVDYSTLVVEYRMTSTASNVWLCLSVKGYSVTSLAHDTLLLVYKIVRQRKQFVNIMKKIRYDVAVYRLDAEIYLIAYLDG